MQNRDFVIGKSGLCSDLGLGRKVERQRGDNYNNVEPGEVFQREGLFADDRPITIGPRQVGERLNETPLNKEIVVGSIQ